MTSLLILFLFCGSRPARGDALNNWSAWDFPPITNALGFCPGRPSLDKIVFHNGRFVAVGTGSCPQDTPTVILHSTDGLNWVRTLSGLGTNGINQAYNGVYGMTSAAGWIVGVGFWGQTLSGDGINWGVSSYVAPNNTVVNLKAVAYDSGRFVAVGDNFAGSGARGVIATSTDTVNWTAGTFFLNQAPSDPFVAIAAGGGVFWAATPTRLYRSVNGTSFTYSSASAASGERLLCYGNGLFVRVGNSLKVSTDGSTWVSATQPSANPIDTMTFGGGQFVATAGRDVMSSSDGVAWSVRTNALPHGVRDLAFGNGIFIAAGNTSGGYATNYLVTPLIPRLSATSIPHRLQVKGHIGRQYDILGTNLVTASNWPVLQRVTLTSFPQSWTDPAPATNGGRFYRVSLVP